MNLKLICLIGLIPLLAVSCSDNGDPVSSDDGGGVPVAYYQDNIQPIFEANCSGCHIGGSEGGLSLEATVSYSNLVGTTANIYAPDVLVVPNDLNASVLWNKLNDTGTFGGLMPPGSALSPSQLQLIEDWINMGAPEITEEN